MSLQSTVDLADFEKITRIGFGSFGEVFVVKHVRTGKRYAAKVSLRPLEENSKSEIRNLNREINILSRLNHPTVLRFLGFSPTNFFQEDKPTIITDYMKNGSLEQIISLERQSLSVIGWDDTRKLITIYGIASALKYLHESQIIHRDLKPDNILMDEYLIPKIADFGLSKIIHTNGSLSTSQSTVGIKGTLLYMAPEIHLKNEYSTKTDVYAFAMIVYEIMTNERPFTDLKSFEISWKVTEGGRPEFKFPLASSYQNLIEKCWDQDPNKRPSFDEIVLELEEDSGFITDLVEEADYFTFVDFLKEYKTTYEKSRKKINIGNFIKTKSRTFTKIDIKEMLSKSKDDEKEIKSSKKYSLKKAKDEDSPPKSSSALDIGKPPKSDTDNSTKDTNTQPVQIVSMSVKTDKVPPKSSSALDIGRPPKSDTDNSTKDTNTQPVQIVSMSVKTDKVPPKSSSALDIGKPPKSDTDNSTKDTNTQPIQIVSMSVKTDKVPPKSDNTAITPQSSDHLSTTKFDNDNELYMAGLQYYHGISVPTNHEQALHFFIQSAQLGNTEAMYMVAAMYFSGTGTPINKPKALEYFQMAASKGHLKSTITAAKILNNGDGVPVNQTEAAKYFKQAADAGDSRSMYNYANMLRDGHGVPIDRMEGLKYYKKAADLGDVDAMYLYAWISYNGEDVPVNKQEAAKYYKKAIDEYGDVQSMTYYALMLQSGDSVPMDKKKAAEYFRIAADNGSDLACVEYGNALLKGDGVPMNKKEGARYLKMSADSGSLLGMFEYGLALYRGDGVTVDKRSAAYYLKMAADDGLPDAISIYAQMLENGDGIPVNRSEAAKYYAKLSYAHPSFT